MSLYSRFSYIILEDLNKIIFYLFDQQDGALKDSEFCPWSHWSACMPSCGKGKQTRNRLSLENNGMDPCNGLTTTEEVECDNNRSCEVDSEQAPGKFKRVSISFTCSS